MGIALSLANIMMDHYHIFFTCQDNPSHVMRIIFALPDEPGATLPVRARPVWYDRDRTSTEKKALLGAEFLLKPKDRMIKKLMKGLLAESGTPASWWRIF